MIGLLAEELLVFAVRLYSRTRNRAGVQVHAEGVILPVDILKVDDGKRMIHVRINYGPRWKDEA